MRVWHSGGFKMDEKEIRKYAGLMHELDLTGIEVDSSGTVIRIERAAGGTGRSRRISAVNDEEPDELKETAIQPEGAEVKSPLVGVFYTSPSENEEPFVHIGKKVKKGDVLCVIESMKLMNEILSEYDGVVTEICAENGQVVDFGHLLFRIREEQ